MKNLSKLEDLMSLVLVNLWVEDGCDQEQGEVEISFSTIDSPLCFSDVALLHESVLEYVADNDLVVEVRHLVLFGEVCNPQQGEHYFEPVKICEAK